MDLYRGSELRKVKTAPFGRSGQIRSQRSRRVRAFASVGRCFNMRHSHCRVQVLKSLSDTVGSFLTNATMLQISWSGTSMAPKLGIPVMLMPFLITQNNSCGEVSLASSLRSGDPVHAFGEFGPIHAGSAVAINAAVFRKGTRACLHDCRIIERQRGGVLGVALDRSVADVRKCPFHDLRILRGSSNVIETAEEENRSGNCAENGN